MKKDELVAELARVLDRIRARSEWALATGIGSFDVGGVGGTLTIEIPDNPNGIPEVHYRTR